MNNENCIDEKILNKIKVKVIIEETKNAKSKEKGDTAMAKLIKEIIESEVK